MRSIFFVLLTLLMSRPITAQDITGQWQGILKVQGIQLRLVFHVVQTDSGFAAKMDSPDQGAKGIPVTKTSFVNPKITFEVQNLRMEYQGELKGNQIIGTFRQAGMDIPLNLSKDSVEKEIARRPQEPQKPYPYHSEDVVFENKAADISLAGTLTLPAREGSFPVVILITGSGPQNRDEELMGHKPFLVLADHLTKNGIGVLRFDDRGVGQSGGNFNAATTADFATDVESAITYLKTRKDINKKRIGLIGHSEGGLIAPIVASKSSDVAFIVLLAGPGLQGDQILLLQQKLIGKASGVSDTELEKRGKFNKEVFEIVNRSTGIDQLKADLYAYYKQALSADSSANKPEGISEDDFIKQQVNQIANPWMQNFIQFNPAPVLEKVKCPVLAINGAKDLQVPPKENLESIKNALAKAGNQNVTIVELPTLNHLFQESKTGSPAEYAVIEQTFSPTALDVITKWMKVQVQ